MKLWTLSLVLAATVIMPRGTDAQQSDIDRARLRGLTREIIGLVESRPTHDSLSRSVLGQAANIQLEDGDYEGFLGTARLIRQMPYSRSQYREMSHNLVCHLLEERKINDAKRYAFAFANGASEEDDWTRAHLILRLVNLPSTKIDSLKSQPVDSAGLRRDAFGLAKSIQAPDVTTDLYLAFVNFFTGRKDSAAARRALMTADSARRYIGNAERSKSRAAFIARKAAALEMWSLADSIIGELWEWDGFGSLVRTPSTTTLSSQSSRLERFDKKLFDHYLEMLAKNPDTRVRNYQLSQFRVRLEYGGRKGLADSLSLPESKRAVESEDREPERPYEMQTIRAIESIRNRNIDETERLFRAIPDPAHTGMPARVMINMSSTAHPDDSAELRKRGLRMLLNDKNLKPRNQILADIARERLNQWGDNEIGIDLVNEITDVALARSTVADIGKSTFANLDAVKLRKLVDRIRSREVKDQVLFRLMISMLLSRHAPPEHQAWGVALKDSIRTPDLVMQARIETGKYFWSRGDSARARQLFLGALAADIDKQSQWDRYSVISVLVQTNATDALLAWARSKSDPIDRARAILQVVYPLRARLSENTKAKGLTISVFPDGCRSDF